MKTTLILFSLFISIASILTAEPTAARDWKAKSGHTVKASAIKVEDGKVHLKKSNGKVIRVPLDKLSPADQTLLKEHFKISDEATVESGSSAKAAEGLPHPLGEVSGPVDAGGGSTYFVYLPKSLKQDRKAPLLFYTNAGGGNKNHISSLSEYAEAFGWVLAVSVQSKNKDGWELNTKNCKNCLEHILTNLPVDKDRLHYTGNSGGGAQAFVNTTIKSAYGVMPNIGYIPQQTNERTTVIYGLGGGNDYNRYLTAHAADKYKKNGFHRMTKHGHGSAPHDHRGDGMFWMHCKFLGKEKRKHADEAKDFELSSLQWLTEMKNKNPMRAYSNAVFFKEIYEPSDNNAKALEKLITELAATKDNVLYHEGLLGIDNISGKYFAPLGKNGGSKMKHESPKAARAAEKLKETHGQIPAISEVLDAIIKPTVGG
ncbi:MAG: SHD1 domain-containing protein [Akkermansiaceae bacterium]